MATTRHMSNTNLDMPISRDPQAQMSGYKISIDTNPWTPATDKTKDATGFGVEVFSHRTMPDGTPLTQEDRRYIAAVVISNLKQGEI